MILQSVFRRLSGSASAVLIAVLVVMASGTVYLLGTQFQASWQELSHANRVSLLAAADRVIFQAAGTIRVGRGTGQATLLAEDDPRPSVTAIFANMDARMDQLFRDIPTDLSPDIGDRLAELRAAWNKATGLREGLLAMAAKPRAERRLADTQAWFAAVGAVTTSLSDMSARVAGTARMADSIVGENVLARQYAWSARLAAGDECGAVRSAFAGTSPLTPAQRTQVAVARARYGQIMAGLEELLHRPGAPAALIAAGTDVDATAQAGFKARDAVYDTLGTVQQPNALVWEKQCGGLLATILTIGTLALDRMDAYAADNHASAMRRMAISGFVLLAASLGIVASVLLVRGRIIRPVSQITGAIRRLAAHDITTEVEAPRRDDEFGAMATVLEELRRSAVEAARLVAEREAVRAGNDRRQAAMDRHTQDFGQTIAGVMTSLTQSAAQMRDSATAMSSGAQKTRIDATTTAEGATASARDLGSVAAATEQMASSIAEISRQVSGVTASVRQTVVRATVTDQKVAGLAEMANRIGEVVRLISDIASRTNLLALNATIEAAHAGEAGKGFAVVASEVKALATQTAKATSEISAQVAAIRAATGEAVAAVLDVTQSIGAVDTVAAAIGAAVEEQASVTREIAASVHNVLQSAGQATQSMQQVSSIAEETEITSRNVLAAADEVGRTADKLRGEVGHFLAAMASSNEADRRRYERIDGAGCRAKLRVPGRDEAEVTIQDISRGGAALRCDWSISVGAEVGIGLPGGADSIGGRVVRAGQGVVVITFSQDKAAPGRIDHALDTIARRGLSKAA
jgi:methyl-accepting chemotaxis protein